MPIYTEMIKDKKTGKMVPKLVDGQKQHFIRTYVTDENGNKKQVTRHNKEWLGRDGYNLARQEEVRLKNNTEIRDKKLKNITLHQLKNIYLEHISSSVDRDTLKCKETKLNHFCEIDITNQVTTYPNMYIRNYTKNMYIAFQKQMKAKKYTRNKKQKVENGKILSIKYLNKIHSEISAMFKYGIINGYINFNIPEQVGKLGTPKEIKMSKYNKKHETIDYDEYLRLMEITSNDIKYNTIFDLWFTRGPRPGEIRAFRIKDFDYNKKQLMVNYTLSKSNVLKEPKTASSKAPIDLDDIVNEKINYIVNELKKEPDFSDDWYLFGNKYMPISSNAMDKNKNKYFKMAQIDKHLRLHDFRHSCATWLFSIGIPITVISRILRHQDIATTMKTYTHLVENDYRNALLNLNKLKQKQDQKQDQDIS